MMGSLIEVFQQNGLGSMSETQHLLGQLILESGLGEMIAEHEPAAKSLNQQLQDASNSGLPLMGGLREFFGGGPAQGISQILQPLMRILTGLFLTKPESQYPNCLPNEKALSELAALFSLSSRKPEDKKPRKRRKRKGLPACLSFLDPEDDSSMPEANIHEVRARIPAIA